MNFGTAEQAALGSGADFWTTKSVTADGVSIPSITLTDGPHGVRRQLGSSDHLGLAGSAPATCFPPAVAMAQTWNPDLVGRVSAAIGREAHGLDVQVVLGPGINIKRDPRGGRNFEYYSEDPYLSGVLGTAWVQGIQAEGIGASVKHFAVNNQEFDRMRVSAELDARALHEVYLRAFHRVISTAAPWTVMASYNRINGRWAVQDPWLLTELLRERWGFDGLVVSDWGAVVDRVASVAAGLDLQMPGGDPGSDAAVLAAVSAGALSAETVARAADRVTALARRAGRRSVTVDVDAHHELARDAARQAIVLLRNDEDLLPLAAEQSVAVIGEFARSPRYQGGGSSRVNPTKVDVPLDEISARAGAAVTFAAGYRIDGSDVNAEAMRAEARQLAAGADVAVLFLGLPEAAESEGFDRADIDLPATQLEVLNAVLEVQPKTVVVLAHGGVLQLGPVTAPALLDSALGGQGGGAALADVLYGLVNPSGKLAETVPLRLQDTPAYLNFPGDPGVVRYGEGIYVGYPWYDARELAVRFPFGHGLSYTSFGYSDLDVSVDGDGVTASVTVTNSGPRAGREVAQCYIGLPGSRVSRAPRRLVGFGSVDLEPGASAVLHIRVDRADLAYWDERQDDWAFESGTYQVEIGASSRDIRVTGTISLVGEQRPEPLTLNSTLSDVAAHPEVFQRLLAVLGETLPVSDAAGQNPAVAQMMASFPIGRIPTFAGGRITVEQLQQVLDGLRSD